MYIHLGSETDVSDKEIIGIFDIEKTSTDRDTREFLAKAAKNGNTVYVSYDMPKAFVLCGNKKSGERVYITQVSPLTLRKRIENGYEK